MAWDVGRDRAWFVIKALVSQTEMFGLYLEADGKPLRIFKQPFKAF